MLLSGFTFIRNAKKFDFPVVECIESMLAIVDELIVNVGKSEDGTLELIESIKSPKIRIIKSVWDDSKTDKGLVLSEQTNIALDACQGRWCLYLQADEALNEAEHASIRAQVEAADKQNQNIDGFRFRYLHFYSGYSLVQRPWNWYPSEIRILRRASKLRSYGDAQSFKIENREPHTPLLDAHVFHYGHARAPETMAKKIRYFHRFWHGDNHGIDVKQAYKLEQKNLVWYWGSHPHAYTKRVVEGRTWSPQPSSLLQEPFKRIAVFTDKQHLPLARALLAAINARALQNVDVEIIEGMKSWVLAFFMSRALRENSALVDLIAEKRSLAFFMFWILDAIGSFRFRVAHAPRGTLSKFQARFYTAVNWGAHEKTALGFKVPESEHPKQLARWLGFDV